MRTTWLNQNMCTHQDNGGENVAKNRGKSRELSESNLTKLGDMCKHQHICGILGQMFKTNESKVSISQQTVIFNQIRT